ncbi:porin family protein [uncultured Hymenobacter sp.]|uniref:porin family protein n=1 Tax=uncultured Hymenobacter sp. TaxID=170016 RepID=UPI0035CA5536
MKKTIISLLALTLGLAATAQAQYRGRGGNVSLGLKAGGSLSTFAGADSERYSSRFRFHAGVFANLGLSKLIAFQPELLYSQKGAGLAGNNETNYRLHYVDVPLVFHVNTDGFFLEAGPQIGFLAASRFHIGSSSADNKFLYKTVDLGYVAGLGYQLKHGPGFGLRYNGEFTEFTKPFVSGSLARQSRIRNSALQLYATYSFN